MHRWICIIISGECRPACSSKDSTMLEDVFTPKIGEDARAASLRSAASWGTVAGVGAEARRVFRDSSSCSWATFQRSRYDEPENGRTT
ncbi:MAG: hypothetical protein ACLRMJ_11165 [Alistipes finegoldii]